MTGLPVWLVDFEEKRRLAALEPTLPVPQIYGFEWTEDMREISGFGGQYERACRAMVSAGCAWWSEHPDADPQFRGNQGIYGLITEENDGAEALGKVIEDATKSEGGCTGAMYQAAINHIFAWRNFGSWLAYQRAMREERA